MCIQPSCSAFPLVYLKAPRHRAPSLDFLQERGQPGCGPGGLAPSPHTVSTAALHHLASNICVVWPFHHQFMGIRAAHRVWFGKRPYLLTRYLCCLWRLSHLRAAFTCEELWGQKMDAEDEGQVRRWTPLPLGELHTIQGMTRGLVALP